MDIPREIVWEYIGYTYNSLVWTKLRIDLKLLFGVFDTIRKVFTQTIEAKTRGYKAGQFSFNVKGGRCEACSGQGVNTTFDELPSRCLRAMRCLQRRTGHPNSQ